MGGCHTVLSTSSIRPAQAWNQLLRLQCRQEARVRIIESGEVGWLGTKAKNAHPELGGVKTGHDLGTQERTG